MKVVAEKFNREDYNKIMQIKPIMGNVKNLKTYNEANYFRIEKLYDDNNVLVGYAALFMAHNGIESGDISIEEIVYWGNNIPILGELIDDITGYEDYIENLPDMYYNSELIPEYLHGTLEMNGCKPKAKIR